MGVYASDQKRGQKGQGVGRGVGSWELGRRTTNQKNREIQEPQKTTQPTRTKCASLDGDGVPACHQHQRNSEHLPSTHTSAESDAMNLPCVCCCYASRRGARKDHDSDDGEASREAAGGGPRPPVGDDGVGGHAARITGKGEGRSKKAKNSDDERSASSSDSSVGPDCLFIPLM